jgi:hypothetical protein
MWTVGRSLIVVVAGEGQRSFPLRITSLCNLGAQRLRSIACKRDANAHYAVANRQSMILYERCCTGERLFKALGVRGA